MEGFLNSLGRLGEMTDSFVPAKLPVPSLITRGAELISEQFKSGAFPYRMKFINLEDVVFWQAMIVILLQPLVWNVVGRMEHYTRILSKICFKPVFGVYALALWIFVAGLYRDALFVAAMRSQGTHEQLGELQYVMAGWGCIFVGSVLVLSSFYRLGLTGVYLGDYFGLLMDEKITAFPYNLLSDPMYIGSSLAFLGKAILAKSPAGLLLSFWVYSVYQFIGIFEGSFTEYIYSRRERTKKTN